MKLAYVRWKDAVAEEATAPSTACARLVELHEVGFLLNENEEAVVIGMEHHGDADVLPGRWRLHIPRVSILEMRVAEVDAAFKKKRRKSGSN